MLRRRAALAALPALALPAVLAGCSTDDGAADGTLEVLASFYPLQYVAQQVGGDLVSVSNLTPPAAEPHDLELSPAQVREIGTADLVVYSSGFQTAVDEAVETQSPEHVVDTSDVVTLEQHPGTPTDEDATADQLEQDSGEHADDGHDHAEGATDPHFWLDPTRLVDVGHAVAASLGEADPEHAAAYAENARALEKTLQGIDADYSAGLEECASRTLVTSHEAFGYLAERYDLEQVGIVGLDPEAEPSPARLREVGAIVEENDVSTIFTETLTSPKVADTLANDIGVTTAVLDPLEGLSEDAAAAGDDYVSVMQDNLAALTEGLQCS
ncbi:metal ABC transporter solute-binding protein, Zn/Mn family [Krasilnikoviella flava]|uniref:Zinc transport system substrate-binding protein n=1 Tax=Krasilnikoviella flava TaxID=526729 RepID=A0A1T5KXF2_9MICO|nr:zinc ABC transporter substrate-binding protein [Krasilnikoviella flava]SKC68454.1 zinc transport system substrate-binding protein [Krasilnikoviella flava]